MSSLVVLLAGGSPISADRTFSVSCSLTPFTLVVTKPSPAEPLFTSRDGGAQRQREAVLLVKEPGWTACSPKLGCARRLTRMIEEHPASGLDGLLPWAARPETTPTAEVGKAREYPCGARSSLTCLLMKVQIQWWRDHGSRLGRACRSA